MLGIAALAAFLYAWNIAGSGYASYYSVAARRMSVSWKAFLFTALDPSATITLDKIGGFLWPQALSARVFGFHAWALTLPQCVEGVVSVLVMYRMVRRWQGPAAGLLAAGSLALTPVAVSMFGHAMLDGVVVMCLTLAADQYQKAAPQHGFHVLRQTYASIMLEAGESVVTLARRLGHSSPAVTLGYYAHFMPEAGSKGRTAIDGLLGRQGDQHASRNSPDSPQG
ncbi:glycosyltransferase family 39 protein [Streptomyces sp. NPDC019443]|uniref:glycosyltransferase family 39 protein n=1 Tax=Streptomyces sp. NPDC019443 TaxID=3365061 RepID=UPI0037A36726